MYSACITLYKQYQLFFLVVWCSTFFACTEHPRLAILLQLVTITYNYLLVYTTKYTVS